MSYGSEAVLATLKDARVAKGLSQRDLSARTGMPQSHISKIESGGTDIRLSSLIELVRVLDLELKLVPRRAVPAVETVIRSMIPPAASRPDTSKVARELDRTLHGLPVAASPRPAYRLDEDGDEGHG